ncbi:MAG: hypothetical protein AB1650_07205 [Candidatus Omnitrophota bacterium]
MTRDEIYDHLAQVYLGKKNNSKSKAEKKQFSAWLVLNLVITVVIFGTSFYGFTAFLTRRNNVLQNRVIFSLNKGPIGMPYNLSYPYPPVKTFSIAIPEIEIKKYKSFAFAVRGVEGNPGTLRIEMRNSRNETASVFVDDINRDWQGKKIPISEFEGITDWSSISEILFVLESWNTKTQKGLLLIDDVGFTS